MVTEKPQQRLTVIGSGGIGAFYGALLHRVGWQVEMVARSDHDAIARHGLAVSSKFGDLSFRPRVYASAAEAEPADWLLIAVKMLPDVDLAELVRPLVRPHTRLLLIANGLDVEQPLADAFPNNPLVSGVAFVCSTRIAPGRVEHTANGRLLLGSFPAGDDSHSQQLTAAFSGAGIDASVSDDITAERWKKSLWNASFNPLSVLANGADTERLLATPESEQLVRSLMQEVIEVATAEGHPLPDELIDRNISATRAMGRYINSMALDYLSERPLELDAIVGRVLAAAERHQLPIPHLRTVYQCLLLRQ